MRFYSKKGPIVSIFIWAFILGLLSIVIHDSFYAGDVNVVDFIVILIFLLVTAYFIWVWFQTYYEVQNDILKIVSGPRRKQIKIKEIISIKRTLNPFTGPALSMDRMSIKYGPYQSVLVSPKEKKAFIEELLKQNPNIQVEFKPSKKVEEK